jgi:hypothetical protein
MCGRSPASREAGRHVNNYSERSHRTPVVRTAESEESDAEKPVKAVVKQVPLSSIDPWRRVSAS